GGARAAALLPPRRRAAAAARRRGPARGVRRRHGQVRRPFRRHERRRPGTDRAIRSSAPRARAPLMTKLTTRINEAIAAARDEDYLLALTLFIDIYGGEDAPTSLNNKAAAGLSYFGLCLAQARHAKKVAERERGKK